MLTFAQNNDDPNLKKNYACTWNSSTSITLDRAWEGANGNYLAYNTNLAGYGQQPFMLGINTYRMNLLATQTDSALSSFVSPYQTFTADSTAWIWNTGMDPDILGTHYGRVFTQCEPNQCLAAWNQSRVPFGRLHVWFELGFADNLSRAECGNRFGARDLLPKQPERP
jgi:hypothetical protein